MEHLHIGPRRWYYVVMLLLALGFVATGLWLVTRPDITSKLAGWPAILFFGACAIAFVMQIADTRPRLVVDDRGVYDRTLGIGMIPWSDIEDAYVRRSRQHPFICLTLRNEEEYLSKLKPVVRALTKANVAMGFKPINLNLSGVDSDPDTVCALILAKIQSTGIARSDTTE